MINVHKRFLIGGCLCIGIIVSGCQDNRGILIPEVNTSLNIEEQSGQIIDNTEDTERLFIYICGYVAAPGVYEMDPGMRIIDAINAAGGFLEEAADTYLNLADLLTDGQKVYVPAWDELENDRLSLIESTDAGSSLININKAAAEQLMTLPGVGASKAGDIIDYREAHGNFRTIDDIKNVAGIKEGVFNKIREMITVD